EASMSTTAHSTRTDYRSEDIVVLDSVTSIRKRPGMYVGDTGEFGLHHLLWELLDNCLEEVRGGRCRDVEIELLPDGGCSIRDDGSGIPVHLVEPLGQRF